MGRRLTEKAILARLKPLIDIARETGQPILATHPEIVRLRSLGRANVVDGKPYWGHNSFGAFLKAKAGYDGYPAFPRKPSDKPKPKLPAYCRPGELSQMTPGQFLERLAQINQKIPRSPNASKPPSVNLTKTAAGILLELHAQNPELMREEAVWTLGLRALHKRSLNETGILLGNHSRQSIHGIEKKGIRLLLDELRERRRK